MEEKPANAKAAYSAVQDRSRPKNIQLQSRKPLELPRYYNQKR